jgi:hypothetical protein
MATVFGLEVGDLDDGVTPIEVVVSLKGLDENGRVILYERMSAGLSGWEAIGMLMTHSDGLRAALVNDDLGFDVEDD